MREQRVRSYSLPKCRTAYNPEYSDGHYVACLNAMQLIICHRRKKRLSNLAVGNSSQMEIVKQGNGMIQCGF